MPSNTVIDVNRRHDGNGVSTPFGVAATSGDSGTDLHSFTMPAGLVFNICSLQVESGQQNPGARLLGCPLPGSTESQIEVRWYFDGGSGQSYVQYKLKATTIPKVELRPANKVVGFLPSTSGFHFKNKFSNVTVTFKVGPVTVPLQGANGGACGGMAFTTRDLFEAGFLPPLDEITPRFGALYDTIMNRLGDN